VNIWKILLFEEIIFQIQEQHFLSIKVKNKETIFFEECLK